MGTQEVETLKLDVTVAKILNPCRIPYRRRELAAIFRRPPVRVEVQF